MKSIRLFLLAAMFLFAAGAQADLARVGPVNAANGFPSWYQDLNGMVLDLCLADNPDPGAAQQTACLLVTPPPYTFPALFPDEAFYHRVVSAPLQTSPGGKRAILVLALEAAFGSGVPQVGQQMVFTRIRVTAGVPFAGTYTITHPYGTDVATVDTVGAGNRDIFFTIDTGLAPLNFTDALTSRVGPFIQASSTGVPGGPPAPPVTIGGAQFLGDGVALVKITGSPFGFNWFEMCGPFDGEGTPDVCIRTEDFALTGRLHDLAASPIGSPLTVERATFARDATGNTRIDVAAIAAPGIGQAVPKLSVGGQDVPPVAMVGPVGAFKRYFAQDVPVPPTLPSTQVMVTNFADNPPSSVISPLTDDVVVSSAVYDAAAQTLVVSATSSDKFGNPGAGGVNVLPALSLEGFPTAAVTVAGDVTTFTVSALAAPQPSIVVGSTGGGSNSSGVAIVNKGTFGPGVVFAQDDNAAAIAGGPAVQIDVLFNDTEPVNSSRIAPFVVIRTPPTLGGVQVDALGVVTYTPGASSGVDTFKYTVPNLVGSSNVATVTVTNAVNPSPTPTANADSATVVVNTSAVITVLANDNANGGTLDPASVVATQGTRGTTTVSPAGAVTYTPTGATAGSDTFTYTVKNTNGNTSNSATVTVAITAPEVLTVTRSEYTSQSRRWRVIGTSSVRTPHNVTVAYANGTMRNAQLVNGVSTTNAAGQVIGTAPVDALGNWTLDFILPSFLGILNPTNNGNNVAGGSFWTSPPRNLRETSPLNTIGVTSNLTIR